MCTQTTGKAYNLIHNTLVQVVLLMSLLLGLVYGFSGFLELIVLNLGGQMSEKATKSRLGTHLGLPVCGALFLHEAFLGTPPTSHRTLSRPCRHLRLTALEPDTGSTTQQS